MLDRLIYIATAPIRLFGRSRGFRLLLAAVCVVAGFFAATLWALDYFLPVENDDAKRAVAGLPTLPPLQPVSRVSYVIAPVAVALTAIRASLDASAPHDLTGKSDNPVSSLLSKANIGIAASRGGLLISGRPNEMTITAPLTGQLSITGQLATQAGNIAGTIGGLLGGALGQDVGKLAGQVLDQGAELRGRSAWCLGPRSTPPGGWNRTSAPRSRSATAR